MKKQNDPKKTNYSRADDETKTTLSRQQEAIDSIPKHCWWLIQYLRGVYYTRSEK